MSLPAAPWCASSLAVSRPGARVVRRGPSSSPTSPARGSYLRDTLPGMLMAGFALVLSGTAMAVGVLTSNRHEEAALYLL